MNKLLNDITTGKDNTTHEIIRVFAVVVIALTILISLVGTSIEVIHFFQTGQFDLQSFFQANMTFLIGVGTFLLTVAGAIKLKQSNEPDDTPNQTIVTHFEKTTTAGAPA